MSSRRVVRALVAGLVVGSVFARGAGAQSNEELQRQVDRLRAEVAELKAQSAPAGAPSARDVDATIAAVARDAETRSHLLAESGPFLGGWMDNKFQIRSGDGNYVVVPGVQFQFRTVTDWRENGRGGGSDNTENGFEVRRLKFSLDGNAVTPKLLYSFVWATDRKTGDLVNEEAWVRYALDDHWAVRAGQYKENVSQEQGVSSRRQLAVDRSLLNELVNNGESFVQGAELIWTNNVLRAAAGLTDGYSSRNTNFEDPPANQFDFGFNGRVEFKVFGDWKDYIDFTAVATKRELLVFSAGFDASQQGDTTVWRHAADVQYETPGRVSLFGGYVGRYTTRGGGGDDSYDWGVIAQAVYGFTERWEVFARADYTHLDAESVSIEGNRHDAQEYTVGLNYYLRAHYAKVTLDASYLPQGSPANADSIGVLSNRGAEILLRAQVQLML